MREDLLDFNFLEPTKLLERLRTYFSNELPEATIYTSKMKTDGIVISAKVYTKDNKTAEKRKICYFWAHYNQQNKVVGYKFYYQRNDSDDFVIICDFTELTRHIKIALTRERVYLALK
jgi:hypothetical protein